MISNYVLHRIRITATLSLVNVCSVIQDMLSCGVLLVQYSSHVTYFYSISVISVTVAVLL